MGGHNKNGNGFEGIKVNSNNPYIALSKINNDVYGGTNISTQNLFLNNTQAKTQESSLLLRRSKLTRSLE